MAKTPAKKVKKVKDKDLRELNVQLAALKAMEHNPINWVPIIRLIAPVLGRLAARYAASYLAGKWNKRATPKIRKDVAENVGEKMSDIITKYTIK